MNSIAFTLPLPPGGAEALRRLLAEVRLRPDEHAASRRRVGIVRESAWVQRLEQRDVLIVYVEGDDPEKVVDWLAASPYPYDRWFVERTLKSVGLEDPRSLPLPAAEVFSWAVQTESGDWLAGRSPATPAQEVSELRDA